MAMEKRKSTDRRKAHLFVSNDRRTGPFDRRSSKSRHEEIESEKEKIARIRAYKAKDKAASSAPSLFTPKRLVFLGVALLILFMLLFFLN